MGRRCGQQVDARPPGFFRPQVVLARPDTVPTPVSGCDLAGRGDTHSVHRAYYYDYENLKILLEDKTLFWGGTR